MMLHAHIVPLGDGVLFQVEAALRAARYANWANMGSKTVQMLSAFVLNAHLFLMAQCWVQATHQIVFAVMAVTGYLGSQVAHPVSPQESHAQEALRVQGTMRHHSR